MTRENISTGSSANDGTGDTLRSAGTKINANFTELYTLLGGNANTLSTQVTLGADGVIFEGDTPDGNETSLKVTDPTADRTITLPNATGTISLIDNTETLTNKTLTTPVIASITNSGTLTVPTGGGIIATKAGTETFTNKTLTSPIINTGKFGTSLNDTNGNEVIKFTATSSAVNELTIANGASTTGPTLSATGSGANLDVILAGKGTGAVNIAKAAFAAATMTGDGAVSGTATYIIGNKGSTLVATMANGTVVGEYKIFTNKGVGALQVTPTSFSQGTSFTLAQHDGCTCIWDGTNWSLVGNQGEVTVA
tara:strand:+ start:1118 stop:2047 length:930 start_codon:yes stop_codon:yes gene_type:complete